MAAYRSVRHTAVWKRCKVLSIQSNTPQQAAGYLALAAVAKYPCKHGYLARCFAGIKTLHPFMFILLSCQVPTNWRLQYSLLLLKKYILLSIRHIDTSLLWTITMPSVGAFIIPKGILNVKSCLLWAPGQGVNQCHLLKQKIIQKLRLETEIRST